MLGNFLFLCCHLTFFKTNFFQNIASETIGVSNSLEPDQDRHSVGPDLDPKLFAMVISRREKSKVAASKETVMYLLYFSEREQQIKDPDCSGSVLFPYYISRS